MLLILFQLVTSRVWHLQNLGLATATIVISLSLSLAITVALKWRQTLIQEHRVHLAEPNTVFAYRGGHKVSVQEEELTVGDLVFVDYNQTIPATGILTSRDEIELEEVEFGRGLQTKMPLEDCLESLTSKN
jgi:magnesium-transporting ATPase (P-type)